MQSLPSIRILFIDSKNPSSFTCLSCKLAFTSLQDLLVHKGESFSNLPSKLGEIENPINLKKTAQNFSPKPKIKCKVCKKKFEDKYTMKFHQKQEHQPTSEIECPLCGKVLLSRISYKKHYNACKRKFCEESVSLCRK